MIEFIISQTYRTKEDRDSYLKEARKARVEELSQAEKGNIHYEYLLPTDGDEKRIILLEMWETAQDQKVHTTSAHFAAAMELKKRYVETSSMERRDAADTVMHAVLTRRSCKSYREDLVPDEVIDRIVEAGLYAANGMGKQAAVIIKVTDRETRDKLSELNAKYDVQRRPDPFYGAPVVLCVVVPKADYTGVEDGSLVIGNMLLAAHSLGIGSCWIHRAKQVFEDPEGIEILKKAGLDDSYMGVGNCVLGYPKREAAAAAPRKEGRVREI